RVFRHHTQMVRTARFAPDGETIVSSAATTSVDNPKGELFVWKAATGEIVRRLDGFTGNIMHLAFADKGKMLVGNGVSVDVNRWDLATGKPLNALRFPQAVWR